MSRPKATAGDRSMTLEEILKIIDDYKRSLGIIPGKEWYEKEMARQKATDEERFMGFVNQIGLEKVEYLLKIYKSMFKPKKSLGTDPDPKAGERLNEPDKTTPTE